MLDSTPSSPRPAQQFRSSAFLKGKDGKTQYEKGKMMAQVRNRPRSYNLVENCNSTYLGEWKQKIMWLIFNLGCQTEDL